MHHSPNTSQCRIKERGHTGKPSENDRFTLSPQGKLINMIENLTKQKQALVDQRNSLVETTLGDGGKLEDIKDQLKSYKEADRCH